MNIPVQLANWRDKHGISEQALVELMGLYGLLDTNHVVNCPVKSEGAIQNEVRIQTAKMGWRMWRNNVGALIDKRGVPVRYGLANDTKEMNKRIKSSDLIGFRPLLIQHHHVGKTIAQFVAYEIKKDGWKFKGDEHEMAQLKFLSLVTSNGGHAKFINNVDNIG